MRILFMGTPDFALFSLKAICEDGKHEICGVITQPDKPKGRGYTLTPPPVKVYALDQGLSVYQPNSLRGEEFDALLKELDPDLIAVVAYGKILPLSVIEYPKHGCINVHGSLLPEYRGAAPMQRAIIEGKSVTGVTIMYMAEGLDTGDMLLKRELPIAENDDFEAVHDGLGALGAQALLEVIESIENGSAVRIPQDDSMSTYAHKITKEDCLIDFSRPVREVHDLIRGLSPVPLSFTHTSGGKMLKVIETVICKRNGACGRPGQVLSLEDGIEVACAEGSLKILRVLPEGKARMSAADFIRGRNIAVGDILS